MLQRFLWIVAVLSVLTVPFAAQTQKPVLVKAWADKSTDVSGRVSRDGRILPFIDSTNGVSVRDLASGEVRALVPGKQSLYPVTPTPSPDGKQIAYVLENALHIVPVAGGPSKVVFEHPQLFVGDWTADAAALVVTKMVDVGRMEIGIVNIANGTYRRLGERRGVSAPSVSVGTSQPFVVYDQWIPQAPNRNELRVVSLADGHVRTLLTGEDDFSPRWSPKDDAVIFMSNRGGRRGIWSIAVRGGRAASAPRLLHELSEDLLLNGLTTDGTAYLAGAGATLKTYVARVTWPDGEVSKPTAITTPQFLGSRRPVFSPDGKLLATVLRTSRGGVRPGWQTPSVTEVATGRQWTFPSELTVRDEVGWMADGQSLIVINDESTSPGAVPWTFWRLSMTDKSLTRLGQVRSAGGTVRLAGITAREIVYKRLEYSPVANYVEVFDLKTRTTRELYRATEEITDVSLSPDGKQLAMSMRTSEGADIYLLRIGEQTPSKLVVSNFRANSRPQVMWVATQDALILTGTIGQEEGIWRVPISGDAPRRLKLDVEGLSEARLSPDLQTVAYTTQPPRTSELWMLRGAVK